MRIAVLLALALTVTACATAKPPKGPPSFVPAAGAPATPQMRFYVDCITQAAANNTFDREGGLIRFRCDGPPAQAFYEGLAAWSARAGSETVAEGRTWRSTLKVQHDLSGVDYCWRATAGSPAYGCTVAFNAGAFIAP